MKIENILNEREGALEYSLKYYFALREMGFEPDGNHLKFMIEKALEERIDPGLVLSVVATESSFREDARNRNRDGTGDYGYFQLNDRYHKQYKSNTEKHIETGIEFLKWCLSTENNNESDALARYNSGNPEKSAGKKYARDVLSFKRELNREADV